MELLFNIDSPIWQCMMDNITTDYENIWSNKNMFLQKYPDKTMDWRSEQRRNFSENGNESNTYT